MRQVLLKRVLTGLALVAGPVSFGVQAQEVLHRR